MKNDKLERLEKAEIKSLVLILAVPGVIANLVQTIYNLIDRIFIGQMINKDALAAIGIGSPTLLISISISALFIMGGNALQSVALGQKNIAKARNIKYNVFIAMLVGNVFITLLLLIFLKPLLYFFGANSLNIDYAYKYYFIITLGKIISAIAFGLNGLISGEGNPKQSMIFSLIGAVINIVLDPILIYFFGIEGGAIATFIGQIVTSILVLNYHFRKSITSFLDENGKFYDMKLNIKVILKIVKTGVPSSLNFIFTAILIIIINILLAKYSDTEQLASSAMSIFAILTTLINLVALPCMGIAAGMQPIVGYNYGNHNFTRVKQALKWAVIYSAIMLIIMWGIFMIFPEAIIKIFGIKEIDTIALGKKILREFFMVLPLQSIFFITSSFFQSVKLPRVSLILTTTKTLLLNIPLSIILANFFSLEGIWLAAPFTDIIIFILTLIFLSVELKNLKNEEEHDE